MESESGFKSHILMHNATKIVAMSILIYDMIVTTLEINLTRKKLPESSFPECKFALPHQAALTLDPEFRMKAR